MEIETLCKILNFFMGMLATYVLQVGWARYRNWRHDGDRPLPKLSLSRRGAVWFATGVVLLGSILVGVQSFQTDNAVRHLTLQTQDCYRQFSEALQARADIASEDNALDRAQQQALATTQVALYTLINTLLNPPPELAALPPNDQRRELFSLQATQRFYTVLNDSNRIITESITQQQANDALRQQHPIPKPTCGQ